MTKKIDINLSVKEKNNLIARENREIFSQYQKQNLIYSVGLIDYLPDRVLKRLVRTLYEFLEKEGKIILTHRNKEITIPPICPDWFCNWSFVNRTKNDVVKLLYESGVTRFFPWPIHCLIMLAATAVLVTVSVLLIRQAALHQTFNRSKKLLSLLIFKRKDKFAING